MLWDEGWNVVRVLLLFISSIDSYTSRFVEPIKNIHCIGDRANKIVLDILEQFDEKERAARRPRIEHAQIMRMMDIERAGKLGGQCSFNVHVELDINVRTC